MLTAKGIADDENIVGSDASTPSLYIAKILASRQSEHGGRAPINGLRRNGGKGKVLARAGPSAG